MGNTHTLAESVNLAFGCDLSFTVVRAAREIRDCDETYEYEASLEGNLTETRTVSVDVPAPTRTEFFVANAEALPFPADSVDVGVAMNLIDVVPDPVNILRESVDRVLSPGGRFVVCDPYAWNRASDDNPENWIGGVETDSGPERSEEALRSELTDELGHEIVDEERTVPWTLKRHPRSYETWIVDCVATEAPTR